MKRLFLILLLSLFALVSFAANPKFAKLDHIAVNTPSRYEDNVPELAEYLNRFATCDADRARLIFTWIAVNIEYDHEMLRSGDYSAYGSVDRTAQVVLNRKKGICSGYAKLYKALADEIGLPVRVVSGYAKGAGYKLGMAFDETNHAWNLVKFEGEWHHIDACWAAGKSLQKIEEFYFCTPSKQFALSHISKNPKEQLLSRPFSKNGFEQTPWVWPNFFNAGFTSYSPRSGTIKSSGEKVVLMFRNEVDQDFWLNFSPVDKSLGGHFEFGYEVKKSGNCHRIEIEVPEGSWVISVSAKGKESFFYSPIVDYRVVNQPPAVAETQP